MSIRRYMRRHSFALSLVLVLGFALPAAAVFVYPPGSSKGACTTSTSYAAKRAARIA